MATFSLIEGQTYNLIETHMELFRTDLSCIELTVFLENHKEKLQSQPMLYFRIETDPASIDRETMMAYLDTLDDVKGGSYPLHGRMLVDKEFLKSLFHKFFVYGNVMEGEFFVPFNYKPDERDWKYTSTFSHNIHEKFIETCYKHFYKEALIC